MMKRKAFGALTLCVAAASCDRPPVQRNCDFDGGAEAGVACPNLNDPQGRIEGTLIYQGPPPPESPTRPGVAAGRIILLLFNYDNPPPPEGTASIAVSFQTVSAAQLFRDAQRLPDGTVRASIPYTFPAIPAAGVYQIRAFYSRNEQVSYDYVDANGTGHEITAPSGFQPLFSVRNLPVQGDVGGGAIVDPAAAVPQFQRIVVGDEHTDPATGRPTYTLPETGAVTGNVTVFIGAQFATERPMFSVYLSNTPTMVQTPTGPVTLNPPNRMTWTYNPGPPRLGEGPSFTPCDDHTPRYTSSVDPGAVPPPSPDLLNYATSTGLLPEGSPILEMNRNVVIRDANGGTDVPAFSISVSLPKDEARTGHVPVAHVDDCAIAALAGVHCPADPPRDIGFYESAFDANQNGTIDLTRASGWADAHPSLITTSPFANSTDGRLPWLYPLVILTKLHDPTEQEARILWEGENGTGTISPTTYAQIRRSLNQPEGYDPANGRYPVLVFGSVVPGGSAAGLLLHPWAMGYQQAEQVARVAIVPIAVEVHGPSRATDWWAVLGPGTPSLIEKSQQFLPPNYRCAPYDPTLCDDWEQPSGIPAGRYAINLLGPGGQAWTLPNELGGFDVTTRDLTITNGSIDTIPGCAATETGADGAVTRAFCAAPSQGLILRMVNTENPGDGVVCPDPAVRGSGM